MVIKGRFGNEGGGEGGEQPPDAGVGNKDSKSRIVPAKLVALAASAQYCLRGLTETVVRNKIGERLEGVRAMTNEEIASAVNASNATSIEKSPSYYLALAMVVRERGLAESSGPTLDHVLGEFYGMMDGMTYSSGISVDNLKEDSDDDDDSTPPGLYQFPKKKE